MVIDLAQILALQSVIRQFDASAVERLWAEEVCRLARPLLPLMVDAPNPTELFAQLDALDRAAQLGPLPDLQRAREAAMVKIARTVSTMFGRASTTAIDIENDNRKSIEAVNDARLERELAASVEATKPRAVPGRPVLVAAMPEHGGSR